MHVLSLSANEEARFYVQQVDVLRELGVTVTTASVPGDEFETQARSGTRTPLQYLKFVANVVRECTREFDVVHANYGLTAPAALAQLRYPVVLSLWGSDLMGTFGPLSKLAARVSDDVVVMSERMAAELDQSCHVVPHGVDLDRFEPTDPTTARREVGWDEDRRVVFFPYAKRRAVKNYPLAERVVTAVDTILDDDVVMKTISGVPHDRMSYYYSAADALLLTSKYEGSPNSVKEALACNCPVVSTDVGDVPERLAGVSPSSVCQSEAELVQELSGTLRENTRSNGREQIRDVTIEQTGRRLKSIYESASA